MAKSRKPDAAESNAGDDFHVLWTIRKCLELLNFSADGLKAVAIEGLTNADEQVMTGHGDVLLGVDLTEYYGSDSFKTADSVIVSQLKYSTRNPNLNWTTAAICKGKKHAWRGSIVHRLASFYSGFRLDHARDKILQKLTLKLVSNRPASTELVAALSEAQELLYKRQGKTNVAVLLKELSQSSKKIIQKISGASGLKSQEFCDFLRIFDLSDCNVASRFDQKQKLIKAISETGNYEAKKEFEQLHGLVRNKMLPEGQEINTIRQEDILYLFGFADLADLLPVTPRLETSEKLIARDQVNDITLTIKDPENPLTALHGGAGIGKSTIVSLIARQFAVDSLPIIYDCYGGGTYLDSEDKRHKHENAFLQLSNELAIKTGTPFLLTRSLGSDTYLKEFRKRLEMASGLLRKINPDALVVIIIDACDNSVNAAAQYKESCFVHDLVKMSIPNGCRLVITSRSERLKFVELPDIYKDILINPFSLSETAIFLKQFYPSILQKNIEEFWKLTTAIPRVMSYALDMPGATLQDKLKPLKPGGKTLDDIFKVRIREADRRSGNKAQIASFLTYLITLPRPVPACYIQQVSGISDDMLTDISTDLWRGLIYNSGSFSFRDEDFENYLRKAYPTDKTKFVAIADTFLANAENEEYASTHLGPSLSNAGMKEELRQIVLERKYLQHPQDPIKNKEVFIERTRLAMQISASETSNLNIVKLQLVAAEAAKTNNVLEEILLNSAELASSYGNLQMNQKIYFQSGNPAWFGSVHFRSAAVFSRDKETHNHAKDHLRKVNSWLSHRQKLNKEKQKEFTITAQDIAYGAEAVLHLSGVEACINWISEWRPKSFLYEVIQLLLYKLIENTERKQFDKWFAGISLRIDIQLLVIKICFAQGIKPPIPIEPVLRSIETIKRLNRKFKISFQNELMSFCEYSLMIGVEYSEIKEWLDMIVVDTPHHVPTFNDTFYDSLGEAKYDLDLLFRKSSITAVFENIKQQVADFYPETLLKLQKSSLDHEKRRAEEDKGKFDRLYKHFLPAYRTRADFLFKKTNRKALLKQLQGVLNSIEKDYELTYRHEYELQYIFKFLSVRLLDIVFYHRSETLIQMIEKGFLIKNRNNILLYLALAERISLFKFSQPMALKLLEQVEKNIENDTLPGNKQLEHYRMATIIASRISRESGKYYFDKMVLSSSEVDIEAHQQIIAFSNLVKTEDTWQNQRLSFDFARYVEYCHERLRGWDHFPWDQGVEGIFKLDPATSFPVICRWDHRNVRLLDKHLIELLNEALEQGYIDHNTAAALLPLNKYYWPGVNDLIKNILSKFDTLGDHSGKEIFVKEFIKDLQLHYSPNHQFKTLRLFWELIKDGKLLEKKTVSEFKEYYEKVAILVEAKFTEEIEEEIGNRPVRKKDNPYGKYLKTIDINDINQINELIRAIKKESKHEYLDAELFFQTIREIINAGNYISHLEMLINFDPDIINYWSYKNVLAATITQWGFHPEVKIWKKKAFFPFLKAKFSYVISYDFFDIKGLKELATLFDIKAPELATCILNLIPEYLDELSTTLLYQLLDLTCSELTKAEKQDLLEWVLPRWSEKIKDDFGDGVWNNNFTPPDSSESTVAEFVRYSLGHPDKRLRWRAGHSLRRFAKMGSMSIIGNLFTKQDHQNCGQFQDSTYPYYWLSAKVYFWIAIERITKENGKRLLPYAGYFIKELKNKELPHAQIKYFVKSACITLKKLDKSIFDAEATEVIKNALVCKLIPKPKIKQPRDGSYKRKDVKTKFRFDTLDTVPYWYDPLADTLDCTTNDVLILADKYITQYWGYTGDGIENDPARSSDWNLTSNRHGSEPTIENLRTYFEYHAMFCAAGELLETREVVKDSEKYRTWDGWIKGWALCWDDFWLSDLRDPIPLLPKLWVKKTTDINWEWDIQLNEFDNITGLKDADQSSFIPINLGIRIQYGKDSESSSISSALVASQYASALLKALQTSPNLDHYIRFENDREYHEEDNRKDKRFTLKGWLKELKTEREGIDDGDELFQGIDRSRLIPGDEFTKWAKLKFSGDYRYSYKTSDPGNHVTLFETWNNHEKEEYYGTFSNSGSRLLIKCSVLLDFLKASNQCLILQCGIKRRRERSERYEYYNDYTLIYLIHPDGKVETISRDYKLR